MHRLQRLLTFPPVIILQVRRHRRYAVLDLEGDRRFRGGVHVNVCFTYCIGKGNYRLSQSNAIPSFLTGVTSPFRVRVIIRSKSFEGALALGGVLDC